jgi:hypothetical protein
MAVAGTGPVPIDPRWLRPSRGWYAVPVVIVVVGWGLSIVAIIYVAMHILPTVATEFEAGSPTAVHLTTEQRWAVYVEVPAHSSPLTSTSCAGRGIDGGSIELRQTAGSGWSFTTDRHSWSAVYKIRVSRTGEYELTCQPDGGTATYGRYALGDDPNPFAANRLGGVAGAFILPSLVAGTIATVIGWRRRAHKRRLQQAARVGEAPR